jgi:hypothetical protein
MQYNLKQGLVLLALLALATTPLLAQRDPTSTTCPPDITVDDGQEIVVKQGGAELGRGNAAGGATAITATVPSFQFEHSEPRATVPNTDCKDRSCPQCGWYKAFWVFGDGNYAKFADNVDRMDADSRQTTHNYARSGAYEPVVYLTERYHNTKKPDAARARLNLALPSPGTANDRPVRLSPDRRVDIDRNHDPRRDYSTVFVVSHEKSSPNAPQVYGSLFFYNSLKQQTTGTLQPSKVMNYERSEHPSYYLNRGFEAASDDISSPGASSPFSTKYGSSFLGQLNRQFMSCVEYDYNTASVNAGLLEGLNEQRVFPVLRTENFKEGTIPTDSTVVVSLLLGDTPLADEALRRAIAQFRALFPADADISVPSDLRVFFGTEDLLLRQGDKAFRAAQAVNAGVFVRGIAISTMPVLASHDPNNLSVDAIKSLGGGQYRVFFRMRICNEGEMPEENIAMLFYDLSGGHFAGQPVITQGATASWDLVDGRIHRARLGGFSLSGVPLDYAPSCDFVLFHMDTDLDGVKKLYVDAPRALKVCITFSGGAGDCSENDVLKQGALQKPDGSYPGLEEPLPTPNPEPDNFWLFALLGLLLLVLLLYALLVLFKDDDA